MTCSFFIWAVEGLLPEAAVLPAFCPRLPRKLPADRSPWLKLERRGQDIARETSLEQPLPIIDVAGAQGMTEFGGLGNEPEGDSLKGSLSRGHSLSHSLLRASKQ